VDNITPYYSNAKWHCKYTVHTLRGERISSSQYSALTLQGLIERIAEAHIASVRALHRAHKRNEKVLPNPQ
jgi:hypothetical protein